MQAPKAKQIPHPLTIHNDTRIDNYYWLNNREDAEVIHYLEAENKYTEHCLEHLNPLRETIYNEIIGRIKPTDESVPYRLRAYWYYHRFVEGGEYPVYCRRKDEAGASEEILLDVNELAKDLSYCQVASLGVSPNNRYMAYGIDTVSRRLYNIRIKDLHTGEMLTFDIPNTGGSVAWANDSQTFFYAVKDEETLREAYIFRRSLTEPDAEAVQIYFEADDTFTCDVETSKSDKYIFIASSSTVSDEYRFLDADQPLGKFQLLQARERNLEYSVDHLGNYFYIRTNLNAQNFRLMKSDINNCSKENWQEVIAHRPDTLLDNFELFSNYLVVAERFNANTQLRVMSWTTPSETYTIAFDEDVYETEIGFNPEMDATSLRFHYSSLTTPDSVFEIDMDTRVKKLLKQQEVVGDFDASRYESKRLWAEAKDGVRVPISLVYRKGLDRNCNNPLLLYGYGSYGISIDPYFNAARLSLIDRGFVFAIAHIRGGQELGREWYENGKMLQKKNTFTDFIACANHLIDLQYTNSQNLFAMGGSAGGLLMGAVVNLEASLFKGIIAAVPFVDVVTTMLDEDIPLTTGEYDEWGNPNEKPYYDYMKSYSPYDNVEPKNYPNMLVTTGLHDSQVQYWEPAKWVAKLREMKTDSNQLLLHTNMEAGHGGASGRFERHRETALEYAFLLGLTLH